MSSKSTVLQGFNKVFFDFFDDISHILPENPHVIAAINAFSTIRKANPTTICKGWHKFVVIPYGDEIQQGNISFFFDKDYTNDLQKLKNSNQILDIIDTIREPMKNIGDENRVHVATYIQQLSRLAVAYNSLA